MNKIGTLAAIAAIVGTLLVATPAQANETSNSAPKPPSGTCWFDADTEVSQCFETNKEFKDAVRAQTGTDLVYASTSATSAKSTSTTSAAAGTYVLAILYWSANYADAQWVVTTANSTLCTAYSYTYNSITGGWNNQIGSFRTYGTCKVRLADGTSQSGSLYGPYTSRATIGAMNDRASSWWITG